MYAWLVPRVVLPLYDRLSGRPLWAEVERLRALQWRPPEELEARAVTGLRELLAHAISHVPYYRACLGEAGFAPSDIRSIADLARVPVTTKRDLRARFPEGALATNLPARRRRRATTSGSMGAPLTFYADGEAVSSWLASYLFFLEWAGVGIWDTRVYLATEPHLAHGLRPTRWPALLRRLALGERTIPLFAPDVDLDRFRSVVAALGRRRYFLHTYPSYAAALAARLLDSGIELPASPVVVLSYAETLTPSRAALIARGFRCPVVDQYSSREVLHIAQSCPDAPDVLHVNSERAVVRVVDDGGRDVAPGQTGRVVVTDLANRVMPLINYDLGDRAVAGARCPCGRGLPTLRRLDGRAIESLWTPDGREVTSSILGTYLTDRCAIVDHASEFQAIQSAADALLLRVVPREGFAASHAQTIASALERLLGPGMTVRVETVARIDPEPSGKRPVIKALRPA
jgi:phenylacetate-CoA ligase